MQLGKKLWAIPEGYIPRTSNGPTPDMESHDSFSVLNANDTDAHINVTVYFTDRDPVGPYAITAPAKRSTHVRFNNLTTPQPVPRGVEYSSLIESDVPIVVQYTRLDSRQGENALMSVMAFPGE